MTLTLKPVPPSTVRVRILVAVYDNGKWIGHGHAGGMAGDAKEWINLDYNLSDDNMTRVRRYHWIEADVPLPEPETTIAGEVTEDGE